ncbi:MAG: HD domain-containing phosphohydrolase [Candidatus Hydrogenedentales bacterium]
MAELGQTFRALIVDDDTDVRTLVIRALREVNVRCDEAEDGVAAENALRARRYDLVVSDLRMPRLHGHRFVTNLLSSAIQPRPIVIVMTALVEPKLTADLLMRGVTDLTLKPFDYEIFAVKARAYLDRRMAETQAAVGASTDSVINDIGRATTALRSELEAVSKTFQASIEDLERKKEELEQGFVGSVRVLTNLMEQVGQAKGSHAVRVGDMAAWIARRMRLHADVVRDIEIAALLHDIGQFGMPDSVRMKPPWGLSPEDRIVYTRYPTLGAMLLSEIPSASRVVEFIENHAERYDGTGFPSMKQGEYIPQGSRIIGMCDGLDTFCMHLPPGEPNKAGREHLREQSGKAYDPDLIAYAFEYLNQLSAQPLPEKRKVLTVPVLVLRPGMTLAEDVFGSNGRFLMRAGSEITTTAIRRFSLLVGAQTIKVYLPESDASPNPAE